MARSEKEMETFVRRYLEGESVAQLAKEARISRPGFYLWVGKYKAKIIDLAKTANMAARDIEAMDLRDLKIENAALKEEAIKLKQHLFEMMLATDRI